MHVIVRLGDGKFYTTPAFAICHDTTTKDKRGRLFVKRQIDLTHRRHEN